MSDNKQKLINLVSALEEENIIDYCYTFIGLKVYGKTKLPDSIRDELGRLWEQRMLPNGEQQENRELTEDERKATEYRCNIVRMMYDTDSLDIIESIYSFVMGMLSAKRGGVSV